MNWEEVCILMKNKKISNAYAFEIFYNGPSGET